MWCGLRAASSHRGRYGKVMTSSKQREKERSVDSWQRLISMLSWSVLVSLHWCANCIGIWKENRGRLGRNKKAGRIDCKGLCQNPKPWEDGISLRPSIASKFITSQHTTLLILFHCSSWSFPTFILWDSSMYMVMPNWFTVLKNTH